MLQRQQGRVAAALLVAMCMALSAIAPPTPVAAADDTLASAGETLVSTSASDAVGEAAAATPLTPASPAAGDDVFLDTFRDVCLNSSVENRDNKCDSAMAAACAALDAKIKANLSDVSNSRVDPVAIAGDLLAPASQARAAACAAALPSDLTGRVRQCRMVSPDNEVVVSLSPKQRNKLMAQARKALPAQCGKPTDIIPACHLNEIRAEKCLGVFRQGKSTFERSFDVKKKVNVKVLRDPKSYTETVTRTRTTTRDCCKLSDRCLCQLKKKLGNKTNFRIACLEKKELEVCK